MARTGDWMLTYTGKKFYPLDPRPEDIEMRDIAHSLSLQCRYNGHTRHHYSVAEHCVLMSETFEDPYLALWALLHDATEAYVGDMIRPLKRYMPDYVAVEDAVMVQIGYKFGIDGSTMPPEVKDADNRILLTEREELLNYKDGSTWYSWGYGLERLTPLPVKIESWRPRVAEVAYYHRLLTLLDKNRKKR